MRLIRPAARWPFATVAALALGGLAAALVTQHVFDMQPCPWCVLQRLVYVLIVMVALPGALLRQRTVQRTSAALLLLLAIAGAAAALWQHFVAAASASCVQTLADRIVRGLGLDEALPAVFAAYAACSDKPRLAGLPYEMWSLALFIAIGAMAALALRPLRRRR